MPFDLQDDEQRRVFKEVLSDAIDDWDLHPTRPDWSLRHWSS